MVRGCAVLMAVLSLAVCALGQGGSAPLLSGADYRLQAGDTFTVLYRITPEYNQTVSVQPDGRVNLQLLGSIPVGGLTLPEAPISPSTRSASRDGMNCAVH